MKSQKHGLKRKKPDKPFLVVARPKLDIQSSRTLTNKEQNTVAIPVIGTSS
jgi:hypothetical protein